MVKTVSSILQHLPCSIFAVILIHKKVILLQMLNRMQIQCSFCRFIYFSLNVHISKWDWFDTIWLDFRVKVLNKSEKKLKFMRQFSCKHFLLPFSLDFVGWFFFVNVSLALYYCVARSRITSMLNKRDGQKSNFLNVSDFVAVFFSWNNMPSHTSGSSEQASQCFQQ